MQINTLDDVFANDPFGLLEEKTKRTKLQTEESLLVESFAQINEFYAEKNREPLSDQGIQEYKLYQRLQSIRTDAHKQEVLQDMDKHGLLLRPSTKTTDSLEGILATDSGDESIDSLFAFRYTQPTKSKSEIEMVAQRKPCPNFEEYEPLFRRVQAQLRHGAAILEPLSWPQMGPGRFYVSSGQLVYLHKVAELKSGAANRYDRRTHTVYENGLESTPLLESLAKDIAENGQQVSVVEPHLFNDGEVQADDLTTGYIYVLRSLSTDLQIKNIPNLYKIGYTQDSVEKRIKNAEREVTYLCAPVKVVATYKCYNINTQKLEKLLHKTLLNHRLELDYTQGTKRISPKEWYRVELEELEAIIENILGMLR